MAEAVHSRKVYWRVWFQLLMITVVEIIVAFLPISHYLMALLFPSSARLTWALA